MENEEIEKLRAEVQLAEQAEAKAQEVALTAIRDGQEVYNDFWCSFDLGSVDLESLDSVELDLKGINIALGAGAVVGVGLDEILKHRVYLSVGQAVSNADENCKAASNRIAEAQDKMRTATAVLGAKKQLLLDAEK